jgi:adenylyltransferase/sulfurtransferase
MNAGSSERYSRQILFSEIGEEGQRRLESARVAIAGCGALGSFHAAALARAGVGFLDLVDRDYVDWSNLQRQWLYEEEDAREGLPKAVAAARRLGRINSETTVNPVVADLTPSNIDEILGASSLILDGTDNFETRYLLNDYAVQKGLPWIYGAAVASYGLAMPVIPGETCCLRCVYPEPPAGVQPTCETAGVLNTITSLIASLQVSLALRILTGKGAPARITTADVWTGAMRQVRQPAAAADCPCCGLGKFEYLDGHKRAPVSLCGRNAVQIHERRSAVNLGDLEDRLRRLGTVRRNEFALRFFLPAFEMTVFADGRAIIKGTTDIGVARSLYCKYIGA